MFTYLIDYKMCGNLYLFINKFCLSLTFMKIDKLKMLRKKTGITTE